MPASGEKTQHAEYIGWDPRFPHWDDSRLENHFRVGPDYDRVRVVLPDRVGLRLGEIAHSGPPIQSAESFLVHVGRDNLELIHKLLKQLTPARRGARQYDPGISVLDSG